MPHALPTSLRALAAIGTVALGVASLTACSASSSGATALAADYAGLVASGGVDDVEALWAMQVGDPTAARVAGDLLLGASERIEVLELGDATAVEHDADVWGSDLEMDDAVSVAVTYLLAGEERSGSIVLAPREDAPRDQAASWRVVDGLVGSVLLPDADPSGIDPDRYVAGERLALSSDRELQPVPLFAGVYDTQLRGDPYLASEVASMTVAAGLDVSLPTSPLLPTDETVAMAQEQTLAYFEECGRDIVTCPIELFDAADALEVEYPWTSELATAPTVEVEGTTIAVEGGAIVMQTPSGPATIAFSGTGRWQLSIAEQVPEVATWDFALELEVQR